MNADFFFIKNEDADSVATSIVDLVKNRLPKGDKMSMDKIQVLTSIQRGVVGSANPNLILQDAQNPPK